MWAAIFSSTWELGKEDRYHVNGQNLSFPFKYTHWSRAKKVIDFCNNKKNGCHGVGNARLEEAVRVLVAFLPCVSQKTQVFS